MPPPTWAKVKWTKSALFSYFYGALLWASGSLAWAHLSFHLYPEKGFLLPPMDFFFVDHILMRPDAA